MHVWPIIFDTSIWFLGFDQRSSFPSEGATVLSRYLHGYKKYDSGVQVMQYRHHLAVNAACSDILVSLMSITTIGMPCDVLLWVTLNLVPNVGSVGTSVYLLQSQCRSVSGNDSELRVAPGVSIRGCVNDKLKVLCIVMTAPPVWRNNLHTLLRCDFLPYTLQMSEGSMGPLPFSSFHRCSFGQVIGWTFRNTLFSFSETPKHILNNVVYAVQCSEACSDLYTGESKQTLHKRSHFGQRRQVVWKRSDRSHPWTEGGAYDNNSLPPIIQFWEHFPGALTVSHLVSVHLSRSHDGARFPLKRQLIMPHALSSHLGSCDEALDQHWVNNRLKG